jgi:hypothetical protein
LLLVCFAVIIPNPLAINFDKHGGDYGSRAESNETNDGANFAYESKYGK